MDGFTVDTSEVRQLAAGLGAVAATAGRYVHSAVKASATHLKDEWRESADGQVGASRYPKSITYDIKTAALLGQSVIEAEIGPDKSRRGLQAPLGNLIEFGSAADGGLSSKVGTGAAALERTAEDFERGLSKALEDAENAALTDASFVRSTAAVVRGAY